MGRRLEAILVVALAPTARAAIQWDTLINKSRELSMSGILGLIETDILYCEPGTQQPEMWRILQALIGIGSIRVISRISRAPCFEALHQMYGIKPPESVEARNFWLNQASWTEISKLGFTQEDTSYHRINQGSGPQAKVLWTRDEVEREREWWSEEIHSIGDTERPSLADTSIFGPASAKTVVGADIQTGSGLLSLPTHSSTGVRERRLSTAASMVSAKSVGLGTSAAKSRRGTKISEGTTDKWWMDRWQSEAIAVACVRHLTVGEASDLLTVAYFGHKTYVFLHVMLGVAVVLATGATFVTAHLTNWSWISQLVALSVLGYFVNRTAALRAWRYRSAPAFRHVRPELLPDWPAESDDRVIVRLAIQSSGFCHLRGLVAFPADAMERGKETARAAKGRYRNVRKQVREFVPPYTPAPRRDGGAADPAGGGADGGSMNWLSYEAHTSFFGLVVSVVPDNVALRSLSLILAIINGFILLILGFGGTVENCFNGVALGVYALGIVIAMASRGRGRQWTMPEFEVVDLTNERYPASIWHRIHNMKGAGGVKLPPGKSGASPDTKVELGVA